MDSGNSTVFEFPILPQQLPRFKASIGAFIEGVFAACAVPCAVRAERVMPLRNPSGFT
jgi:hypothetical protein